MNRQVKSLLKTIKLYHPLQRFYRSLISGYHRTRLRKQYKKYRGTGYRCNYCESSYAKFAPWIPAVVNRNALEKNNVVAGYGENIICPYCLSTARERLLKAMATAYLNIDKKIILHISPEKLFYDFIRQQAVVTTVDYSPGFYKSIDPFVQFADAANLPFANCLFDVVIGNHIMEHIGDDAAAMKEIYRVLKPGGTAILQVPFSASLLNTIEEPDINNPVRQAALFGQHDHVRIYALTDYMVRLQDAGFTVEYKSYESLQQFYPYAIQKGEGFIWIKKE